MLLSNSKANILIWDQSETRFGHASIYTDKYHMSLWPDGNYKGNLSYLSAIKNGIDASIIYHYDYDKELEDKKDPIVIETDVSCDNLNRIYEKFLNFNEITPDNVTIEAGKEMLENGKKPQKKLNKTKYSIRGTKFQNYDFYKYYQSCTTFCLGLIINAGDTNLSDKYSSTISAFEILIPSVSRLIALPLSSLIFSNTNSQNIGNEIISVPKFKQLITKEKTNACMIQ